MALSFKGKPSQCLWFTYLYKCGNQTVAADCQAENSAGSSSGAGLNSLWPSDTIWRHKSGSTLAQVMACCLTTPSHYLNQCWLINSKVQWHSSECNFTRYPQPSVTVISLKIKFCYNLSGANELTKKNEICCFPSLFAYSFIVAYWPHMVT